MPRCNGVSWSTTRIVSISSRLEVVSNMEVRHDYDDIPGTTVFDAERSRRGYPLNMFCMSLMKAENRAAFKADPVEFLQRFPMSPEQRAAVLTRDWNRMIEL